MRWLLRSITGTARILWHFLRCPVANPTSTVVHTDAGRIFECGCGFAIWDVYA